MRGWEHEGSGWPSWAWHTEGESKERDVLIEGASLGLRKKKLMPRKLLGIHKNDPKIPISIRLGARTGLLL